MTISPEDFRDRLQHLELSQMDAARALLTKHKSVNNWYNGTRRTPGPVELLLDIYGERRDLLAWVLERNKDWRVL
jgi:DNA-binding transcriptional regulator YiaG